MLIKDEVVTIINCETKSGTGKNSGKPYSFVVMNFADDELNKFQSIVPKSVLVEGVVPEWLMGATRLEAVIDARVIPDGFGCKLIVDDIRAKE